MISRSFNSITFEDEEVVKTSSEREKIINEYKHYYLMNDDMKKYLVRPYGFSTEGLYAGYRMIKHADVNAGFMYASGDLSTEDFAKIINAIKEFRASAKSVVMDPEASQSSIFQHTIDKARSRSLALYQISNKKFDNIINSSLLSRLEGAVRDLSTGLESVLLESHGDLCLSNILLCHDDRVRFIDPRGADSIWLDQYYDIAKLSQSILGGYDFIINDIPDRHDHTIQDMFLAYIKDIGLSYDLVRAFEASLFISMAPLHIDRHDHIDLFLQKADSILKDLGY